MRPDQRVGSAALLLLLLLRGSRTRALIADISRRRRGIWYRLQIVMMVVQQLLLPGLVVGRTRQYVAAVKDRTVGSGRSRTAAAAASLMRAAG